MDWEEQNAVLEWEDVEFVEQIYVERLSETIFKLLVSLRKYGVLLRTWIC